MRRRVAATIALAVLAGCGGAANSSSQPAPKGNGSVQGAAEAAKACHMWVETLNQLSATSKNPNYPALDAMASAVVAVANRASAEDPRWDQLALDVAPATDLRSNAILEQNGNILHDCKAVPASANKAELAQPDPFSSTTTTRAP